MVTVQVLLIISTILLLGIQVFTTIVIYNDAYKKGLPGGLWASLNFFIPFLVALVYLIYQFGIGTRAESVQHNPMPNRTIPTFSPNSMDATIPEESYKDPHKTIPFNKSFTPVSSLVQLVAQNGDKAGHAFKINESETQIGYSSNNHVVLDFDEHVSSNHALIQKEGSEFFILDRSTTNGTIVNGKRIRYQAINNGDVIKIGNTFFIFNVINLNSVNNRQG